MIRRHPTGLAVHRTVCVIGVILALAVAGANAAAAENIAVPFKAAPGDTFKVAVEIEDRRWQNDALEAHVKRRIAYDGRIVALGPERDGYQIGWTLKSFASEILTDASGNQPLILAGAQSVSDGLTNRELVFVADASGRPVRLLDWERHKVPLAAVVRRAVEDVISKAVLARRPDSKPEVIAAVAARQSETLVAALITGRDESTAVALVEEAATLAMVQGVGVAPGKPLSLTDRAGGPLTDGDVARTTTYTAAPRTGSESLRITWSTVFDTAALQAAAGAAIRRQLGAAMAQIESANIKAEVQRKFDEQIASIKVQRGDTGESEVDPLSGWARRVVRKTATETRQDGIPTDRRERMVTIAVTR